MITAAVLVACATPAVVTTPVETATVPPAPHTLSDPPEDAPPALAEPPRGTTLMGEQLVAAIGNRALTDRQKSYADRVAAAEKVLGAKGEPVKKDRAGTAWYGITLKNAIAPFGCEELVIWETGAPTWSRGSTDNARCGLPYAPEPTKSYAGPAPKRAVKRLEEALVVIAPLPPADAQTRARTIFGSPDFTNGAEDIYVALGPRSEDAPISCHALYVGAQARVSAVTLDQCGLEWPMPGWSFDPGPPSTPLDVRAPLDDCAKRCAPGDTCMIERRIPATASVRRETDGEHARYPDGRNAPVEYIAGCAATKQTPCPSPGLRLVQTTPSPHILCRTLVTASSTYSPPPLNHRP